MRSPIQTLEPGLRRPLPFVPYSSHFRLTLPQIGLDSIPLQVALALLGWPFGPSDHRAGTAAAGRQTWRKDEMRNFQMAWRATCLALFLMLMCAWPRRGTDDARARRRNGAGRIRRSAAWSDRHLDQHGDRSGPDDRQRRRPGRSCFRRSRSAPTRSTSRCLGFKAADYIDVIVAVGQEYSLTATAGARRGRRK